MCSWLRTFVLLTGCGLAVEHASAQIDPIRRNQIQLGYDQPLRGKGPEAAYFYYYQNQPEFVRSNWTLRLALAPGYFDSELGIKLTNLRATDLGIGVSGGGFGDNYYEVRQGKYVRRESFYGYGGGTSLGFYQTLNPGQLIPLFLVARTGVRYTTYGEGSQTDRDFELPDSRWNVFTRAGLRLAGKEPILYPDLAMELSVWFERSWRLDSSRYGFDNDRRVNPASNLYWLYAGINYAWTNVGHKLNIDFTAGGSDEADRFSAYRLGGVLPRGAEFPLSLPGYYYQELAAERFFLVGAGYDVSMDSLNRWQWRFEGAAASVEYLPGFDQNARWHPGVGTGIIYTSRNKVLKVALRYGYAFEALRNGERGAHSVGILFQYDFQAFGLAREKARAARAETSPFSVDN